MKKMMFDDGYQEYLVEGAEFEGELGIPKLANIQNAEIPRGLVSFNKAKYVANKRQYVHFYIHDIGFRKIFTATKGQLDLLKQFDGVISPDPTIVIGKSKCLHATSTYLNRAVAYFLQRNGIPVIPNIRWGDESSYDFCFLGIPKHSIVAISTTGAIKKDKKTNNALRTYFKNGLAEMIKRIKPKVVIVHGFMPDDIFDEFKDKTKFVHFASETEEVHRKKGVK